MIPRNLGKDYFGINYLFGCVSSLRPLTIYTLMPSGFQAYIYVPKLGWERGQSNEIWECSHSRHDLGNNCVSRLCCYTSTCFNSSRTDYWLVSTDQLRFALSSASVFCRSDASTDSERFYISVLEFLDDPAEKTEVDVLLNWWDWYDIHYLYIDCAADPAFCSQVFPSHVKRTGGVTKGGALASLRGRRQALAARTNLSGS